mmetsp:Transcript_3559/g.7174  ORF Transcript_3559/g.7174 Transcript_3559/m.7174 type:complete len:358 (+) Transcript_3559:303-1376(+)
MAFSWLSISSIFNRFVAISSTSPSASGVNPIFVNICLARLAISSAISSWDCFEPFFFLFEESMLSAMYWIAHSAVLLVSPASSAAAPSSPSPSSPPSPSSSSSPPSSSSSPPSSLPPSSPSSPPSSPSPKNFAASNACTSPALSLSSSSVGRVSSTVPSNSFALPRTSPPKDTSTLPALMRSDSMLFSCFVDGLAKSPAKSFTVFSGSSSFSTTDAAITAPLSMHSATAVFLTSSPALLSFPDILVSPSSAGASSGLVLSLFVGTRPSSVTRLYLMRSWAPPSGGCSRLVARASAASSFSASSDILVCKLSCVPVSCVCTSNVGVHAPVWDGRSGRPANMAPSAMLVVAPTQQPLAL